MGRPKFYRQRIRTQSNSVEGKGFTEYLANHIKAKREISLSEAFLVAKDVKEYLDSSMSSKSLGQIEFPVIEGADYHCKRSRSHQPEKLIPITLVADDDVELMRDFGIHALQNARLTRVIEEAYFQDGILDQHRLQVLFMLNHKAIQRRLKEFWDQGCILPMAGMKQMNREKMQRFRATIAIQRYLKGEELLQIKRNLAISHSTWKYWWRTFRQVVRHEKKEPHTVSKMIGLPVPMVIQWQNVYQSFLETDSNNFSLEIEPLMDWEKPPLNRKTLYQTLIKRHGFSPAAASDFIDEIHELRCSLDQNNWKPGEIGYLAVSSEEGPGRSLKESDLVLCHLEFLALKDWKLAHRDRSSDLKWERIERLSTQAYQQKGTLTQPDLAFILGSSVEAIRKSIYAHENVVIPTRGQIADMGPTISHAEKIIRLWMDGYTETEITRRSGHSYQSIERYLQDFATVICLLEYKMPISAIRTVMSSTRKVVERYVDLYNEFIDNPDGWRLGQLRRMGDTQTIKKKLFGKGRLICRKETANTRAFLPEK